jgi:hypothetical protein
MEEMSTLINPCRKLEFNLLIRIKTYSIPKDTIEISFSVNTFHALNVFVYFRKSQVDSYLWCTVIQIPSTCIVFWKGEWLNLGIVF